MFAYYKAGVIVCLCMLAALAGCAGSGGNATPTSVSLTFSRTPPQAIALQTGTSGFVPVTLQGSQLNFTLPAGTEKYGVAWVCGNLENFLLATLQDGNNVNPLTGCGNGPTPPQGSVTGSFDVSAISGAAGASVLGNGGGGFFPSTVSGSFNISLIAGTTDIAVVAFDNTGGNTLAARILRGQGVPGAVNGGNTIALGPGDLLSRQALTVTNVPSGFESPSSSASYQTAGGAQIPLMFGQSEYTIIPASALQTGDFYLFGGFSENATSLVSADQTTTTAGGPITIALPAAWLSAGPVANALPTFTFDYTGFSGLPRVAQEIDFTWPTNPNPDNPPPPRFTLSVTISGLYGVTTFTVPDLTGIAGFFPPPSSGEQVTWGALSQGGGPAAGTSLFPTIQPNGTILTVVNSGEYIVF